MEWPRQPQWLSVVLVAAHSQYLQRRRFERTRLQLVCDQTVGFSARLRNKLSKHRLNPESGRTPDATGRSGRKRRAPTPGTKCVRTNSRFDTCGTFSVDQNLLTRDNWLADGGPVAGTALVVSPLWTGEVEIITRWSLSFWDFLTESIIPSPYTFHIPDL